MKSHGSGRGWPRELRRVAARIDEADQRWFVSQAERSTPIADAVLPRLSSVADRSVLWFVTAGVVSLVAGRRGRRAAGRGLASIGLASLLANQVGKRIVPRRRPPISHVPLTRRAHRVPASTSFPSGHSASAAAFAVGASLEMPGLAVPLGLTAAAVCWSRVYTGVHYPSDVILGAALGAGSAAIVANLIPPPNVKMRDVKRPTRVQLPIRATGRGVVLVVNHAAGPRGRKRHLDAVRKALPEAEILEVRDGNLMELLRSAAKRAEVLAISGGDGSVNAAAAIAHRNDLPLAVLPGGTLNHFAADLAVTSVADTLRAIRTGAAVQVGIGEVTGADGVHEVFLNTSSLGAYPEFVRIRKQWQNKLGKPVASAIAALAVSRAQKPEDIVVNGEPRRVGLMFIGNGSYQPQGFAPDWRPAVGDGHLDLRLFDARGVLPGTRLVIDLLFGRISRNPHYVEILGQQITITRQQPDLLARDGEIGPADAELTFAVHPRPLTVYCPLPLISLPRARK